MPRRTSTSTWPPGRLPLGDVRGAVSEAGGVSVVGASEAIVRRGTALGADMLPSNDANGDGNGRGDRELARRARAELAQLEVDYQRALDRGLGEESREGIDAAFDEADRLQRQLLVAIRRVRVLEDRLSQAATANGDGAQACLASADRGDHGRTDSP